MIKEGNIVVIKTDTKQIPWVVVGEKIKAIIPPFEKIYDKDKVTIFNNDQSPRYIIVEKSLLRILAESEEDYKSGQ